MVSWDLFSGLLEVMVLGDPVSIGMVFSMFSLFVFLGLFFLLPFFCLVKVS